jgi:hypothetical protein
MFTAVLPGNGLPYLRAFTRSGPHRKHSFPSIVASIRVYRAVAWQRIDQIRYNIFKSGSDFGQFLLPVFMIFFSF